MKKKSRLARTGARPTRQAKAQARTATARPREPEHPVLGLERAAGNAAVARLLEGALQRQAVAAPPKAFTKHRFIKQGDDGVDVALAQSMLYEAVGDPATDTTGFFGAQTEKSVRQFQQQRKLQVDGQIGAQTWAALETVAGDRAPADEAAIAELSKRKQDADALKEKQDFAAAEPIYKELYARRDLGANLRSGTTFSLGACAQAGKRFDEAIGFYQEFLEGPKLAGLDRADALQRIRECRAKLPPGQLESDAATDAKVDPADLPPPGR